MHKRWKYENELKYSPKTESRDREIEFAFTCNSGCYAPFPDAGSLPLFSCGNEASMCVCVNEHLIRDPSWLNERHLGPQGFRDANGEEVLGIILLDSSNLVDVHGVRFNRLWQRYKMDMLDNSWGGNAEMGAIKDLYSVNIVVWQIIDGVARQVNRIAFEQGQAATVHIRWLDERHYETTEIPASYLPMPVPSAVVPAPGVAQPAVRLSGRVRQPSRRFDV